MARAGLGSCWTCLFANDFDHKKSRTYAQNWGENEIKTADVKSLTTADLPGISDLVWGSFPCQDLSLAGGGAGLRGERSGTFWPFWRLILSLQEENRAPPLIALENVCGTLTSHGGRDFISICRSFAEASYRFGGMVVDASLFVPQSRPRLFIIGVRDDLALPDGLLGPGPLTSWHNKALRVAHQRLTPDLNRSWIWWNLPTPDRRNITFSDLVEEEPSSVVWHSVAETRRLLGLMSAVNLEKVEEAKRAGRRIVGTVYKRTRRDRSGIKIQRAEVRFDDVAGCLRTPAGGSSRQVILVVEGEKVRSRLISSRETARLMGLSDDYILPSNYNEAYHLTGDGVVVHVVRFLAQHIFEPILDLQSRPERRAA
jgi:DNA (cytosine-5)-methyltransferase 1